MNTKPCKKCNVEQEIDQFREIFRGNKAYRIGECNSCVRIRKRRGTRKILFSDENFKECGSCGEIKKHNDFSYKGGKPSYRCKSCFNAYYKDYYSKNSDRLKQKTKKYKSINRLSMRCGRHGISVEKYIEMYNRYNGKCWVCLSREAEQIDHNHNCCSGKAGCPKCVRGLLCGPCNRMLGHADDDSGVLQRAIDYLKS